MKITVIVIPQFSLLNFPNCKSIRYRLSDFSYGDFLIFENDKLSYYLNTFGPSMKELSEHIGSTDISVEELIKRIGEANNLNLSINQKVSLTTLSCGEKWIEMEIEEFPVTLWDNYKKSPTLV
jgi:hypothetical protein